MTAKMKNFILISTGVLLFAGTSGVVGNKIYTHANAIRSSIQRFSKKHVYQKNHIHKHIHSTQKIYVLNGKEAVYNHPNINSNALKLAPNNSNKGERVSILQSQELAHKRFFKIIVKDGLRGWINAKGISIQKPSKHKMNKKEKIQLDAYSSDVKNFNNVQDDLIRAEFVSGVYKGYQRSSKSSNYYLREAQNDKRKVKNQQLNNIANENIKDATSYVNKSEHHQINKNNQLRKTRVIGRGINYIYTNLNQASATHDDYTRKTHLVNAQKEINKLEKLNNNIHDYDLYNTNVKVINATVDYYESINNGNNGATPQMINKKDGRLLSAIHQYSKQLHHLLVQGTHNKNIPYIINKQNQDLINQASNYSYMELIARHNIQNSNLKTVANTYIHY